MKIRTKIPVEYSNGVGANQTASGIVECVMDSVSWINNPESNVFDRLGFNYKYQLPDGTKLLNEGITVQGSDNIQALHGAISGQIPPGLNEVEHVQTKFYLKMIQQMALTFDIPANQIEIF